MFSTGWNVLGKSGGRISSPHVDQQTECARIALDAGEAVFRRKAIKDG
ncbi:hypothetical protein [Noviherbaspirillum suwonense]|nr:hypothetical protein [Noviherbaspirillum suwonense]